MEPVVLAEDDGPPPQGWKAPPAALDPATWPNARAQLTELELPRWSGRAIRVLVDAGHGAKDNVGNLGLHCQREAEVMAELAFGLATRLSLMGPFEVRISREEQAQPSYASRRARAERWPADVVVSLHSDVRGAAYPYRSAECESLRNDGAPGFAVLWSNEGDAELIGRRQRLSWAVSDAMAEAGFGAYRGEDYLGLYDSEPEHPGSFINSRHHARRIWFLRALGVPTVIVETHHALDFAEVERWGQPRTRHVFARAVAKALLQYALAFGAELPGAAAAERGAGAK